MFSFKGGGMRLLPGPGLMLARAVALFAPKATEGTWVPADGSGAGLVLTGVSGRWTQTGNVMRVYATFTYPATVNAAPALITGLPGAILVELANGGTFSGFGIIASQPQPFLLTGAAALRFYAGGTQQTNAQMSGALVCISGTYRLV